MAIFPGVRSNNSKCARWSIVSLGCMPISFEWVTFFGGKHVIQCGTCSPFDWQARLRSVAAKGDLRQSTRSCRSDAVL
jgi:uncharacterized protein YycO